MQAHIYTQTYASSSSAAREKSRNSQCSCLCTELLNKTGVRGSGSFALETLAFCVFSLECLLKFGKICVLQYPNLPTQTAARPCPQEWLEPGQRLAWVSPCLEQDNHWLQRVNLSVWVILTTPGLAPCTHSRTQVTQYQIRATVISSNKLLNDSA